jgi:probable rRNA maturation factor
MGELSVENAHPQYRIPRKETLRAVRSVLRGEGSQYQMLNVVFINDRRSRRLNREYLSHDYATDVLAFRLDDGSLLEGEVYVNLDRARVQAREYGVGFRDEIIRLVIHGLLHLLGYRDSTHGSRARMSKKQEEYHLRALGNTGHAGKNN